MTSIWQQNDYPLVATVDIFEFAVSLKLLTNNYLYINSPIFLICMLDNNKIHQYEQPKTILFKYDHLIYQLIFMGEQVSLEIKLIVLSFKISKGKNKPQISN